MQYISKIRRRKFTDLAFRESQSVTQKMGKRAGRETLQSGHAVCKNRSVKRACRVFGQPLTGMTVKGSVQQFFHSSCPLLLRCIPCVKCFPLFRHRAFPYSGKPVQKDLQTALRRHEPQIRCVFYLLHRKLREQLADRPNQIGTPLCFPVHIDLRIGDIQFFGWFCHIQIQIKFLDKCPFSGCRRKFDVLREQPFPFQLRNDPAVVIRLRDHPIIDSDKKQDTDMLQSGSLNITDNHTVIPRRDHADIRSLKSGIQDLPVLTHGKKFLSQEIYHLFKQIHDNPVNLFILLRRCGIPVFLKCLFVRSHLLCDLMRPDKLIKCHGLLPQIRCRIPENLI